MALETTDTGTQTAFAVIAGIAAILVGFVVLIFYFIRDRGMMKEIVEMQRRFDTFKSELHNDQQKKMFKYSKGTQEFLKQYKKPMLQSAFDLQSRLTNQVKNNFLYSFLQERGGERDQNYALYNFSFVFAEFLGWLEVIRQELVFITGDADSVQLASLIEGIKFQLTGETPVQGTAPRGQEDDPEFEADSRIFQLYAGELRSIGSVMIHTDVDGHKTIINADEFQRLMTVPAPSKGASNEKARIDWARSRERLFQDMLLPLFGHLRTMATLQKGQAPIRRLAILQVLLAKLIDMVDNAVPWATGPKFDVGEEPQYITRDFRLTPLVFYLNSHQRKWLAVQPFMEGADRVVADPLWEDHMQGRDAYWSKLCFAGFREDLASLPQDLRDKKPDMWPGACPPREQRQRPDHYIERRGVAERRAAAAPKPAPGVSLAGGPTSPKPGLPPPPPAAGAAAVSAGAAAPAGGAFALVVRPAGGGGAAGGTERAGPQLGQAAGALLPLAHPGPPIETRTSKLPALPGKTSVAPSTSANGAAGTGDNDAAAGASSATRSGAVLDPVLPGTLSGGPLPPLVTKRSSGGGAGAGAGSGSGEEGADQVQGATSPKSPTSEDGGVDHPGLDRFSASKRHSRPSGGAGGTVTRQVHAQKLGQRAQAAAERSNPAGEE